MKRRILSLICAVVLFGCAKEELTVPDSSDKSMLLNSKPVGYVMSSDEIRALALSAPANYSSAPTTRAGAKSIREITPLTSLEGIDAAVRTRAAANVSEPDELVSNIYVVNYENDEGFAVISADNRLPDVLAYSDQGNIPHNIAEIEVPGVIAFLKALPDYAEQETERVAALLNDYNPYPDSLPDSDGYYRMNYRTQYGP